MVLVINGMIQNVIEISTDNKELTAYRGFLRIKEHNEVLKDIPFDTIHAIFITARGVVYTNNLLQALCENGIPLIILGKNFIPSGILTSFVGQQKQTEVQQIQIESSKPLQKQLWTEIVKEKIRNQSRVLDLFGKENKIKNLWNDVLSGDTSNVEGQAARYYFHALFEDGFVRNTDKGGINSFLNYGYAIIRACVARFVVAAGLNPSFGIQHHNKLNPFCLVDDLMEPYRPLVDVKVYKMFDGKDNEKQELTPEFKREFAELLHKEFKNGNGDGVSELITIIQNDIWAFVKSLKDKKNNFSFNKNLFII